MFHPPNLPDAYTPPDSPSSQEVIQERGLTDPLLANHVSASGNNERRDSCLLAVLHLWL